MRRFLKKKKKGPPDAGVVMERLIIVKFQVVTALASPPPDTLATIMASWDNDEKARFIEDYRARAASNEGTLQESGLWSAMTAEEQSFIRTVPTEMSPQALIDALWLMESAECLLFALGFVDQLPPYDSQANPDDLKLLPATAIAELVGGAALRDQHEIVAARDLAELWHWRARTRQLQESGQDVPLPEGYTLVDVVRMTSEHGQKEGLFTPIDGDFPAFGAPYRAVSDAQYAEATSIAMERHKALNWLCGFAPGNRWDETPTDT